MGDLLRFFEEARVGAPRHELGCRFRPGNSEGMIGSCWCDLRPKLLCSPADVDRIQAEIDTGGAGPYVELYGTPFVRAGAAYGYVPQRLPPVSELMADVWPRPADGHDFLMGYRLPCFTRPADVLKGITTA